MRALLLLLSLVFSGCIQVEAPETNEAYRSIGIDDDFHTYVQRFEKIWGHQATSLSMFFVEAYPEMKDKDVIGLCRWTTYPRTISVLAPWWRHKTDDTYRELLIFHELGHCLLGLDHDETLDDNDVPTSIMYPQLGEVIESYRKDKKAYINRLFKQAPTLLTAAVDWECIQ